MSASNRIHPLPLHLANQIAAGEVIERPASVVKELVENSLDAGATEIVIDIEGAGSQLIRVRDNGAGIHPEDLPLALSRHATSKLQSSEQLSHIASLGFRGEALPSITSISQLTITSRQHTDDTAWQIKGDSNTVSPASHPYGTTIEVRELFFNLPARRHFLRSNKTEQHHILTTVQRLALSQFNIGFQCKLSDSQQLKLPIANTDAQQRQRLAKICGKQFIDNSLFLKQDYDDISLTGWLAKAEAHRPQTDVQYFFINGRVIRDRVINHAIRQAFGNTIPAGRHPAYVLYLTLPLDRVDINVHPTKHEVRFRDARLIHGLITTALEEALSQPTEKIIASDEQTPQQALPTLLAEKATDYNSINSKQQQHESSTSPFGQIETLLHHRYAITQSSNGPLLLDLVQVEQQIRTQQMHDAISQGTLRSRPILVPIKLTIASHLISVVEEHAAMLDKLGFELDTQDSGIIIKRIPSLLAQADLKSLVLDVVEEIAKADNEIELERLLIQHLPHNLIASLDQAKGILQELNAFSIDAEWCKKLDQQTLDSLFSRQDGF
jgi:DNA mismatch repair protein MutL